MTHAPETRHSLRTSESRPDTLARQAYAEIRRAVRAGRIVPGTFYSEFGIAADLGISRTPVREALIELAREGMVEKVPQRGFRLRPISPAERDEVFELRSVLESHVASELARHHSAGDVRALQRLVARQERLVHDVSAFLEADEEFHLTTAAVQNLTRTGQMMLTLRGIMWLIGLAVISRESRRPQVLVEHREILDKIAAGDPSGAARAVRKHIAATAEAARAATETVDREPRKTPAIFRPRGLVHQIGGR